MTQPNFRFNVRVYGLFLNENNELLLADEFVLNRYMTKFPGGGLEYGEGTIDCLKREAIEEFGQEINVIRHFYTTDYFQKALFYTETQLLSIYYLATLKNPEQLKTTRKALDIPQVEGGIAFRWVKTENIEDSELTFPIDRVVLQMLKKELSNKK